MGEGPEVKGKWVANDQNKVGKRVTRAVFRGAPLVKPGATLVSLRCVGKRIIAKFEGPGAAPVAAAPVVTTPVAATPPSADDPPEPPAKRARGEALAGCRFSIAGIAGRDRAELRETGSARSSATAGRNRAPSRRTSSPLRRRCAAGPRSTRGCGRAP